MKDHTQPRLQAPHTPNGLYCIDTLRNPDTLAPGQPTRPNLHPTGRVGRGVASLRAGSKRENLEQIGKLTPKILR
jgi:hypothetical protein